MSRACVATTPWPFGDLCKAFEVFLQLLFGISPEEACDQRAQTTGGRIITEPDAHERRAMRRLLKNHLPFGLDIAAHGAPGDPPVRLERDGLRFPFDA